MGYGSNKKIGMRWKHLGRVELLIHNNVVDFLQIQSKGMITVDQSFHVGLVKSHTDGISVASLDAMALLKCSAESTGALRLDDLSIVSRFVC